MANAGKEEGMSIGAIIAIIVVALIIVAVIAIAMPRMRANARERELARRRIEVANAHRDRASDRAARAEEAEQIAARERAEAELHETRARLHERGLADDELDTEQERLGDERFTRAQDDSTVPPEERSSRW
jgi:C4-dicarboxylate-specific signal transduction histidine kinase